METFGKIIVSIGMFFGSIFGSHQTSNTQQLFGNYNPSGGGTYRLQSSIGLADVSITLSSFKEPTSNIPYTMTYLNSSIEYGTLDPQSSTKEFISFTGITQNTDGTATLTGVQRGLGFSYPYTASTTLEQPHSGQSIFILSNPPQLTNQYANRNNNDSIYGSWIFSSTSPPHYDTDPVWANFSTQTLADVAYVNSVVAAGCANSSETVNGCVQLATQLQAASTTSVGSTGARLVIPASMSTSTPGSNATLQNVMSLNDGKLSPNWFNGVSEQYTFNGGFLSTATSTFSATTTINASSINKALVLNTLPYFFPSARAASSTVLSENGSGGLTWENQSTGVVSTTTTFTLPTTNGTSVSKTVFCVAPKVVSGGGISGLTAGTGAGATMTFQTIIDDYPSAAGAWTVTIKCQDTIGGGCSGTGTVYALCVNP